MKPEEVTCTSPIMGGKYGSRDVNEKFTVDSVKDAEYLEGLGLVSRQKVAEEKK